MMPVTHDLRRRLAMPALGLFLAALVLAGIAVDRVRARHTAITDAGQLVAIMDGMGYAIAPSRRNAKVPRLWLRQLPPDLAGIADIDARKRTFLRILLPLVLAANEHVLVQRSRLEGLRRKLARGPLSPGERRWLAGLAAHYGLALHDPGPTAADIDLLLRRVDAVPPSLALAQAAVESAWGTSRLARRGNALFGQISSGEDAIAPRGHGNPPFRFARFDSLRASVDAYVANLDSHPAYREFRRLRAAERKAGHRPDGRALAATLTAYAGTGKAYVKTLQRVIDDNRLAAYDGATLADSRPLVVLAAR